MGLNRWHNPMDWGNHHDGSPMHERSRKLVGLLNAAEHGFNGGENHNAPKKPLNPDELRHCPDLQHSKNVRRISVVPDPS